MDKSIKYYDNHWAIHPYYIGNTSIDTKDIPGTSNILMIGMGGLFFPTLLPSAKFTIIEFDQNIIDRYEDRLTDNMTLIKGDAYDEDLIKGLYWHDYVFFDIWTTKQDISVLNELRSMYKIITTEDKMFHLKSIFR